LRARLGPEIMGAMRIGGREARTIWLAADGRSVEIFDQTRLPHEVATLRLETLDDACRAIRDMQVRGAPLIGVTAAYGLALALRVDPSDRGLDRAASALAETRPTAVNLRWALDEMRRACGPLAASERAAAALVRAGQIADEDVVLCRSIGEHGLPLIRTAFERLAGKRPVHVLTHCNAGWLATVDWGTALAPIYAAHRAGIPVFVWVDETRPRNQGLLTAFELGQEGVPHAIVVDNAGGHLMQRGLVDLCIVGTDRTTARGDVANKIGTYLKALAAHASGVPFYVAAPGPSIDWSLDDGMAIPIEERHADEVLAVRGRDAAGRIATVTLGPPGSGARNPAFDVTPAALVTAFVTERGVAAPRDLAALYGRSL
jgi:methylthioribose-1-phosphate isomerase